MKQELDKKRRQLVKYFGFARIGASLKDIYKEKQDHRVKVWSQAKEIEWKQKLGILEE